MVGGIIRNNGRHTATEEMIEMGAGDLFELCDKNSLHREIEFPGHRPANLYSVARMEPMARSLLETKGIAIHCPVRVTDAEMKAGALRAVLARQGEEARRFEGEVFIDATGTAGGPANCNKYGNGCAMCVLRCHSFGGRVSVTAKAGVKEMIGFVRRQMQEEGILSLKFTFSGSVYFERMQASGLYSTDRTQIDQCVGAAGLTGVFAAR